jgi:hypothetical protein
VIIEHLFESSDRTLDYVVGYAIGQAKISRRTESTPGNHQYSLFGEFVYKFYVVLGGRFRKEIERALGLDYGITDAGQFLV